MAGVTELSVLVEHPAWPGGRCAVVVLSGEADVTSQAVEDVLAAESAKDPALLLVDLSAVSFMDSWSLHVVLRAMAGREGPRRRRPCLPLGAGAARARTDRGRPAGTGVRQQGGGHARPGLVRMSAPGAEGENGGHGRARRG